MKSETKNMSAVINVSISFLLASFSSAVIRLLHHWNGENIHFIISCKKISWFFAWLTTFQNCTVELWKLSMREKCSQRFWFQGGLRFDAMVVMQLDYLFIGAFINNGEYESGYHKLHVTHGKIIDFQICFHILEFALFSPHCKIANSSDPSD